MLLSRSTSAQYAYIHMGWGSWVCITTRCGLEGPGIESQWGGEIFRTIPDRPWGPPILLYNGHRVFPGGKAAGAWRWPPTSSSVEVKERVEQYLYSPFWAFVACCRVIFTFTLPLYIYIYKQHFIYRKHFYMFRCIDIILGSLILLFC